jgi:hypothetical protein
MPRSNELEIRCFCSRHPLLAVAGRDRHGEPYVHLKVFRQQRIFAEMVATSGVIRLRCRECLRWHTVRIRKTGVAVDEGTQEISDEMIAEVADESVPSASPSIGEPHST